MCVMSRSDFIFEEFHCKKPFVKIALTVGRIHNSGRQD